MPTAKQKKVKNPHDGSNLDEFLSEEGILEEVEAAALKRAFALKLADLMDEQQVQKARWRNGCAPPVPRSTGC